MQTSSQISWLGQIQPSKKPGDVWPSHALRVPFAAAPPAHPPPVPPRRSQRGPPWRRGGRRRHATAPGQWREGLGIPGWKPKSWELMWLRLSALLPHGFIIWRLYYIYLGVVQNTFSRTALNRSANRVASAVPQWAIAEGFVLRWSDHIHKISVMYYIMNRDKNIMLILCNIIAFLLNLKHGCRPVSIGFESKGRNS